MKTFFEIHAYYPASFALNKKQKSKYNLATRITKQNSNNFEQNIYFEQKKWSQTKFILSAMLKFIQSSSITNNIINLNDMPLAVNVLAWNSAGLAKQIVIKKRPGKIKLSVLKYKFEISSEKY